MPEDHLRAASFERSFRGVLGDGGAVTAKGMTQAVALPFELGFDAGSGAGLVRGGQGAWSNSPTQAQVLTNKLDELLTALKRL